jgi:hypothetical protein
MSHRVHNFESRLYEINTFIQIRVYNGFFEGLLNQTLEGSEYSHRVGNKTGNECTAYKCGVFLQILMQYTSNMYFKFCLSVTLIFQHAKLMRLIILPSVACMAVPHFQQYLMNGTISEKKKTLNITCFDFPYDISLKSFSF